MYFWEFYLLRECRNKSIIHTFLIFITFSILCFFVIFCYCFLDSGMFTIFYSELALVSQHLFFFLFDCIHHQSLTSLCLFDFVSPIFLLVCSSFAGFHLSFVTPLSFNPISLYDSYTVGGEGIWCTDGKLKLHLESHVAKVDQLMHCRVTLRQQHRTGFQKIFPSTEFA